MKNSSKYYLTYCIELIGSLIKTLRYLRHQNNDNPLTDYNNISKTMSTHVTCRHVRTCPDQRLAFSSHSSTGWDLQGYVTSVRDNFRWQNHKVWFWIWYWTDISSFLIFQSFMVHSKSPMSMASSHLRRHDVGSAASGRPRAPKATQDEPTEQSLGTRENMTKYDTLDLTWLHILSFWHKVWLPQSLIPSRERTSAHYGFRVTFSGSLACIFGGVLERLSTVS